MKTGKMAKGQKRSNKEARNPKAKVPKKSSASEPSRNCSGLAAHEDRRKRPIQSHFSHYQRSALGGSSGAQGHAYLLECRSRTRAAFYWRANGGIGRRTGKRIGACRQTSAESIAFH